jgi:peptidoglycan/LPS O-acetylase OafA/YrhL
MDANAIVAALFVLGGIGILGSGLARWGRTGTPPRRVGGMALIGLGALVVGATVLSRGAMAGYLAGGILAALGAILLATRAARKPGPPLPRLRRRR